MLGMALVLSTAEAPQAGPRDSAGRNVRKCPVMTMKRAEPDLRGVVQDVN